MANLFVILDTNAMTESEWQATKKLDKSDQLVFVIPESGMISYKVLPYFLNLKKIPEIFPFSDAEPLKLAFFIGLQCSSINSGKCYIITEDPNLAVLDEYIFELEKASVKLLVMPSLEAALLDKKGDKPRKKKAPTTITKETDSTEEDIIDSSDVINEIPVSDEFILALEKYSTASINLVEYKEILAECVADATEGVLSSFELQLAIKFGEELGTKIFNLLDAHLDELKNLL